MDILFTKKIYSYETADQYYRNLSSIINFTKIHYPLLSINSLDDKISSPLNLPFEEV